MFMGFGTQRQNIAERLYKLTDSPEANFGVRWVVEKNHFVLDGTKDRKIRSTLVCPNLIICGSLCLLEGVKLEISLCALQKKESNQRADWRKGVDPTGRETGGVVDAKRSFDSIAAFIGCRSVLDVGCGRGI